MASAAGSAQKLRRALGGNYLTGMRVKGKYGRDASRSHAMLRQFGESSRRWPACTPSKLPIATALGRSIAPISAKLRIDLYHSEVFPDMDAQTVVGKLNVGKGSPLSVIS